MIDPSEFLSAGFTEAQAATLVRAFERVDRASAQRFDLLQTAFNDVAVRLEQEAAQTQRAISVLATAMAEGFAQMERSFAQVDARFDHIDERLGHMEEHLREPGADGGQP